MCCLLLLICGRIQWTNKKFLLFILTVANIRIFPSPWLCSVLGADTLHMNLAPHEHVSNNQKIKVCQHFFRPKGTEQRWHGALPGSTESNDLFIKHRNTNMGRGEVLTLELKVQAGEKIVREGEEKDTEMKQERGEAEGEHSRGQGVQMSVRPFVFTQFHPSNKSFNRGIRREVKKRRNGQKDTLHSTAANGFLQ